MWKLNRGIDTISSLSAKCPSRLAAAHPKVWHLLKHVRWRRARRSGSKARERLRRKRRRHAVLAKQRKVLHSFSTIAVFFFVSSSSLSLNIIQETYMTRKSRASDEIQYVNYSLGGGRISPVRNGYHRWDLLDVLICHTFWRPILGCIKTDFCKYFPPSSTRLHRIIR